MNINRICIVVHFSSCIVFSQWSSFQSENMNNADSYKTNGLAALISSSQYYPFDNEKNFHFGSSISGEINTDANDVCRLLPESKGDFLTNR